MRFRDLRKAYDEVKKIVNRNKYTKEHRLIIRRFKGMVNSCSKNVKELKTFLDDFDNAIDNIENNREEFVIATAVLMAELKEWFRGQNKLPKRSAWDR